jgi:hypothetical protein
LNIEIIAEDSIFVYYWKLNQNTVEFHVLLKWNQNNKYNLWYIKIEFAVFYFKVPTTPFIIFLKNVRLIMFYLFWNLPLWVVPSLFIMIQNQQEFKFQTNKVL